MDQDRKEKGTKANRTYRTFIVYKNYIIGLEATKARLGDSTIFNNSKAGTTTYNTGMQLWTRSEYSICHWKENIFVLYGGIIEDGDSSQIEPDVHFITLVEESLRLDIEAQSCELKDKSWWNACHTAQIYKDSMYVLGGKATSDMNALEVWKFDLNTKTWSKCQISGQAPNSRINPASALFGSRIYLFGGQTAQSTQNFNDLFALNLEKMAWEKVQGDNFLPTAQLNNLQATVIGRKIYLSSPDFDEFFIYDPISKVLDRSEGVSPKEGFQVRSIPSLAVLFRLEVNPSEGNYILECQYFDNEEVKIEDTQMAEETGPNQPEESKESADSQILSQEEHMELLWKQGFFVDVTFVVQNQEILAHRAILLKSKYFQNLMKNGSDKIDVPEISSAAFKAILEYLYLGKIALTEGLALDLLAFTDKFGVSQLKSDCENYLSSNLKAVNLLEVIKVTQTVKLEKLEDRIQSFVAANMRHLEKEIDVSLIPQEVLAKAVYKASQK